MKIRTPGLKLIVMTFCLPLVVTNAWSDQPSIDEQASQIAHKYLLTDTHIDVPYRLHSGWVDVTVLAPDGQFDYPRAVKGGLDLPFMSIYTPAEMEKEGGSFELANQLIDSVEAIAARAPDKFMLVYTVADAKKAMETGRVGLAMGMENGSPIDHKIENVQFFADRGISYITLTHGLSNQISDSSYDKEHPWGGLSPFGKEVITEMNRVGIMVDISHVSDDAFWQTLEVTKVPVIASHSSARKFTPDFERNMSDEMIVALAKNGGVIQINWGSGFLTAEANAYSTKMWAERTAWLKENGFEEDGEEAKQYSDDYRARQPYPYATMAQVVDHFDHVIKLAGVDYVGIGSDYDGVGDSLPVGLKDVSQYPNLVAEFLRRGYSESDIAKILGGNLMRVWAEVEAYARKNRG
ncbi:MAG: dipeptidase [Xanthomonadales bacterium]|nr:dipeptidase [Xanthomonadales bacterium]